MDDFIKEIKPGQEIVFPWSSLHQEMQIALLASVRDAIYKTVPDRLIKAGQLQRIFDLGQPQLIIGLNDDGSPYCRIADCSADVMKVLIKNYLYE